MSLSKKFFKKKNFRLAIEKKVVKKSEIKIEKRNCITIQNTIDQFFVFIDVQQF